MEPVSKKMKLEETSKNKFQIRAILSDEYTQPTPLIEVFIGRINDKKHISRLIKELNNKLPISDLQHLKRCFKQEIIIQKCCDVKNTILNYLEKDLEIDTQGLDKVFEKRKVAGKPVKLRWQFEQMNKIWPCNFHPDKYLEQLYNGTMFTNEELEKHELYLRLAFRISNESDKYKVSEKHVVSCIMNESEKFIELDSSNLKAQGNCNSLINTKNTITADSILDPLFKRGAIAVDPSIDSIVAVGYDLRDVNPTQHCCMILIDNVAKSQNGGAWVSKSSGLINSAPFTDGKYDQNLNTKGIPEYFKKIISSSDYKYKMGSKVVIRSNNETSYKNIDDSDRETSNDTEYVNVSSLVKNDENEYIDNSQNYEQVSSILLNKSINSEQSDCMDKKNYGPYLCTGYNVYLTHEPCLFCSMALTHSRVLRLFYLFSNSEKGALGSLMKLHTVKDLNHRFEVYKCDIS